MSTPSRVSGALLLLCAAPVLLGTPGCTRGSDLTSIGVARVSPVSGPSSLKRLGRSIDESTLGRLGGQVAPLDTARREPMPVMPSRGDRLANVILRLVSPSRADRGAESGEPFVLAGADLYRLNCQSCHGPDGLGSPPEVNSLLGPVQGTSAALLTQRLKEKGRPVDDGFVKELASGGENDLRQRLADGGEKMPAFKRLRADEIQALIGYLKKLAAVPEAPSASRLVEEPPARVGEHLVKGTCHICHDATGPGSGRMAVMMGAAPSSLASFVTDYSVGRVVVSVRRGSFGMMKMGQRKMPPFPYLTAEEIAAGMIYLNSYPPEP